MIWRKEKVQTLKDGVTMKRRKKKSSKTSTTQDGLALIHETSGMKLNYFFSIHKFYILY